MTLKELKAEAEAKVVNLKRHIDYTQKIVGELPDGSETRRATAANLRHYSESLNIWQKILNVSEE